jgi:hypothetical protein
MGGTAMFDTMLGPESKLPFPLQGVRSKALFWRKEQQSPSHGRCLITADTLELVRRLIANPEFPFPAHAFFVILFFYFFFFFFCSWESQNTCTYMAGQIRDSWNWINFNDINYNNSLQADTSSQSLVERKKTETESGFSRGEQSHVTKLPSVVAR